MIENIYTGLLTLWNLDPITEIFHKKDSFRYIEGCIDQRLSKVQRENEEFRRQNHHSLFNMLCFHLFLSFRAKEGFLFRFYKGYYMLGNYVGPLDSENLLNSLDKNPLLLQVPYFLEVYALDFYGKAWYTASNNHKYLRKLFISPLEDIRLSLDAYPLKETDNFTGTFTCHKEEYLTDSNFGGIWLITEPPSAQGRTSA